MSVNLSSLAGAATQFFDNNGVPLAGGLIYTYAAGTTTPAATYTSNTGLSAHSNPIVLDAAGRIATGEVWLTSGVDYKFLVKTSDNVQLGSYDNIPSINDFTSIYAALANTTNVALGDALIGFKQSNSSGVLSNAVARTVHQKFQEFISVKDFGAAGDNSTDDTAAFQAAANTGRFIYVPAGTYKITNEITVNTAGSQFFGLSNSVCTIVQNTLSKPIFNITVSNSLITNLTFDYNGTPTAGAAAIYFHGADSANRLAGLCVSLIKVNRAYEGIKVVHAISTFLENLQIYNFVQSGVYLEDCGDIFLNNFVIDSVYITNGALGGIVLNEFCEAISITNGDVLNCVYSMQTLSTTGLGGSSPAHSVFTNVYFDSSAQGVNLAVLFVSEFVGCWFSAGRSGIGFPGVTLVATEGLSFTTTRFVGCGSHGASVTATADRTSFVNCTVYGNSITAGVSVASGIYLANGAKGVIINGITARNIYFAGTQAYGIFIGNSCTSISCSNNLLQGNGLGGLSLGTAPTTCVITNNIGYNPVGGSAVTVGASPYTYAAGASPETLYITGGTVSLMIINGLIVFTSTEKTIELGPNENVQIVYSVLPTVNKVIH